MKPWRTVQVDEGLAAALALQTQLPGSLARVLFARGLTDADQVDRFLKPRLSDLSDPASLPDMDRAVSRIWQAIEGGERIVVYGDYDVDGVTSAALMVLVLGELGASVTPCLPRRIEEGYGFGVEGLDRCIRESHPRLIITTDCGTGSHDAVLKARAEGLDVVVTDHHDISGTPVDAVAVVNPKLGSDASARLLAGVGVAFKLCHALVKAGRARHVKAAATLDLRTYLDLVALGTIADVVPIVAENRILTHHGLARLNGAERVGLQALAEVAGTSGELGAYHVGFVLGPRMNAAGRMGNADAALELLMTDQSARAHDLAVNLDAANRERKRIENETIQAATARIDRWFDPSCHFGIAVGEVGWHIGVVGIVASRLASKYRRPTVVVGFDADGMGRGSCRSVAGFDLVKGLKSCEPHLHGFGGHGMAAGVELHHRDFERFQAAFLEVCKTTLQGQDLESALALDGWVTLSEITDPRFVGLLNQMAPFGEGNPEPVWGLRGVRTIGAPRIVGDRHLKMLLGCGIQKCDAIGFGMKDRAVPDGELDVAFSLRQNNYMGRTELQLHVQDFRPSEVK